MEHEPDPDDWGSPLTVHTGWNRREPVRCADAGSSGHIFFLWVAPDEGSQANFTFTVCNGSDCAGAPRSEKNHPAREVPSK